MGKFSGDDFRVDLRTVSQATLGSIFGDTPLECDDVDQKLWDFVRENGCVTHDSPQAKHDTGDWTVPVELPVEPTQDAQALFDAPDRDTSVVDFRQVNQETLGQLVGLESATASELHQRLWSFVISRSLLKPPES